MPERAKFYLTTAIFYPSAARPCTRYSRQSARMPSRASIG